jgi:hypothetical protein
MKEIYSFTKSTDLNPMEPPFPWCGNNRYECVKRREHVEILQKTLTEKKEEVRTLMVKNDEIHNQLVNVLRNWNSLMLLYPKIARDIKRGKYNEILKGEEYEKRMGTEGIEGC